MDVTREDFPLPGFSTTLAKFAQELETGRSMLLLRGLLVRRNKAWHDKS